MKTIKLPVKLPVKGVKWADLQQTQEYLQHDSCNLDNPKKYFPLSRLQSTKPLSKQELDFLKFEATAIVYLSGADDTRSSFDTNGTKVISSCDVGRGMLLHKDGRLEFGCPYQLWDGYLMYNKYGANEYNKYSKGEVLPKIYASGTWAGRRYYIDTIKQK